MRGVHGCYWLSLEKDFDPGGPGNSSFANLDRAALPTVQMEEARIQQSQLRNTERADRCFT